MDSPAHAPSRRVRTVRLLLPALLVVVWLVVAGWLGGLSGNLGGVTESSTAAYLPAGADSAAVIALNTRFGEHDSLPAIAVYARPGGLTAADRAVVADQLARADRALGSTMTGRPIGPIPSADGKALQVIFPFAGSEANAVTPLVVQLRAVVMPAAGLSAQVTGPAGTNADMQDALGAIDVMLVLVTAGLIFAILAAVYRSPLLPVLVLVVAGTALAASQGVVYLLAAARVLTIGAEVQGILAVLVLGCATDYALLLVARYREELGRHPNRFIAMAAAWRASIAPIAASAITVILALLCLTLSGLGLNRQLGPAAAIGIGFALLAMTTFLPALLALLGRTAFWPRRPRTGQASVAQGRLWAAVARLVGRRPRLLWISTAVVLGVLGLGALGLNATGIPDNEMILTSGAQSTLGQQVLTDHYPAGAGNPVVVVTRAGAFGPLYAAVRRVPGVQNVAPDTGTGADPSVPLVVDGLARMNVTLDSAPSSDRALATVTAIRAAAAEVPSANAKVGGFTAVKLDFNLAAEADRAVMPLLLGVILVVIALLLRAIVAPVLLLGTVVLSYLAAIGVSAVVFQDVLGFSGVDSTFPMHAFVFLVALGVDYNIFLMSRVREEVAGHGTREGTLRGLTATGGVITSAGLVLAATFAALAVLPLAIFVQLAFTIAFGVLLDTFVVRSLLVPALTIDVGRWMWWPGRLFRAEGGTDGPPADLPRTGVPVPAGQA